MNILPTKSNKEYISPHEVLSRAAGILNPKPSIHHFRTYYCTAYYHIKKERRVQGDKWAEHSRRGHFVGYADLNGRIFYIWDPEYQQLVKASAVRFLEHSSSQSDEERAVKHSVFFSDQSMEEVDKVLQSKKEVWITAKRPKPEELINGPSVTPEPHGWVTQRSQGKEKAVTMTDQQQEEHTIDSILIRPYPDKTYLNTSNTITKCNASARISSTTISNNNNTTYDTRRTQITIPGPIENISRNNFLRGVNPVTRPNSTTSGSGPNPSRFAGFNSRPDINSSRIVERNQGSEGTTERSEVGTTRTRNTTPSVLKSNPAICEPRCDDLN
ncbi:hypothetical protein SMAC4_13984 [Sordaria macrospora]|uniref:uncharacterized protein n=1 Tax=Sordaria macrospora TaxID=5147 RepID=UPI002B2C43CE|nr:hypothetical protein SMAC4_13984 [Sordaria macrospora]